MHKNFVLFSCVYLLLFSAYYVGAGGFLTLLYPQNAFIAFAIFYGTYSFFSLVSPLLIGFLKSKKIKSKNIKSKIILFICCICFTIYIAFIGSTIVPLLFIGSFIGGAANSFVWLIQGTFIKEEDVGLFYTFFNINLIIGNLLSLIVLFTGASVQIMIFSTLALTIASCIMSLFLKAEDTQENNNKEEDNNKQENIKLKDNILGIIGVCKKYYLSILAMIYQGIGLNITYQILPKYVLQTQYLETANITKPIFISILYIVYGVFSCVFSYIFGKLMKKHWIIISITYTFLEISCLIGMYFLSLYNSYLFLWLIFSALRGIIDYGINNILNFFLCGVEEREVSPTFGLFRFVYAVSYLTCSILIGYIAPQYILILTGVVCILSTLSFYLFKIYQLKEKILTLEDQFDKSGIFLKNDL